MVKHIATPKRPSIKLPQRSGIGPHNPVLKNAAAIMLQTFRKGAPRDPLKAMRAVEKAAARSEKGVPRKDTSAR